MISVINASPKLNSNSSYFIKLISKKLDIQEFKIYRYDLKYVINKIKNEDIMILAFPLYVDSPPNRLLEFMEQCSLTNKKIYVLCNCGFLESKQNDIAISIIKNWCRHTNNIFVGFFKIGSGEVLGHKSILATLLSPLFKLKIKIFAKKIRKGKKVNLSASLILSKKVFCICANRMWKEKLAKSVKM